MARPSSLRHLGRCVVSAERDIDLTDHEVEVLAAWVAALQLDDVREWLDWEELPLLTEDCFERVADAIRKIGTGLANAITSSDDPNALYARCANLPWFSRDPTDGAS